MYSWVTIPSVLKRVNPSIWLTARAGQSISWNHVAALDGLLQLHPVNEREREGLGSGNRCGIKNGGITFHSTAGHT